MLLLLHKQLLRQERSFIYRNGLLGSSAHNFVISLAQEQQNWLRTPMRDTEINLPSDELLDVASDPADLPVVSGMCVRSALKKLYNCNKEHFQC